MKWLWKLLPIVILLVAGAGAAGLVLTRQKPETIEPDPVVPVVRVHTVTLRDIELTVTSQGTVSPRTQSVLVPEVAGRVTEVSPSFVPGGFFEQGELLLRIDAHDYRQALVQARAQVTQAELRLSLQEARPMWRARSGRASGRANRHR